MLSGLGWKAAQPRTLPRLFIARLVSCRDSPRNLSTNGRDATSAKDKVGVDGEQLQSKHRQPSITQEQKKFLDSALRVNHAGELAATLIYTAQIPQVVRDHPHLKGLMKHMYDQEASHFKTFNQLLAKHRVRPTAMYPVWQIAATALGYGTALMGREAAMACTEAVETEIGEHYNGQVRVLMEWMKSLEDRGEQVGDEIRDLVATIKRIRDEELEHLDHAVEHDAKQAQPYDLLTSVIRRGCRTAIWISEKV